MLSFSQTGETGQSGTGQNNYASEAKQAYSDYQTGSKSGDYSALEKDGINDAKAYISGNQGAAGTTGTTGAGSAEGGLGGQGVGSGFADGKLRFQSAFVKCYGMLTRDDRDSCL